jgi:outer membrane biosynthesis protein TonB
LLAQSALVEDAISHDVWSVDYRHTQDAEPRHSEPVPSFTKLIALKEDAETIQFFEQWPVAPVAKSDVIPPLQDALWAMTPLTLSVRAPIIVGDKGREVRANVLAFVCHLLFFALLLIGFKPAETPVYPENVIELMIPEEVAPAQSAATIPDLPLPEPAPVVMDVEATIPEPVEAAPVTLDLKKILVAKAADTEIAQPKPIKVKPKIKPAPVDDQKVREQREREQERLEKRQAQREAARTSSQASENKAAASSSANAAYGGKVRAILMGRASSLGLSDVKGSVSVSFSISGSGRMASHSLSGSTGDARADRAIKGMLASTSFAPSQWFFFRICHHSHTIRNIFLFFIAVHHLKCCIALFMLCIAATKLYDKLDFS